MAALGKIRSKGVALICVIGLGLFAFIAEEAFRSCESTRNDRRQQIGEVLGKKINVQEYQKLVDEYVEIIKLQRGEQGLNDTELDRYRDYVWQTYVTNAIVNDEAERLGLTVTDEEMQDVLNKGTNPFLQQTPFFNRQTGRFDVAALKNFLSTYRSQGSLDPQSQTIYKFWTFVEKNLRQEILSQKYQTLTAATQLSNPVEAKMAIAEQNEESSIELAAFPYAEISDSTVEVTDADMKAKYEEMKPMFRQDAESRDIKYIDVKVEPSTKDIADINEQFAKYKEELAAAEDPAAVVKRSVSDVPYLGLPVLKGAYPMDVANRLDSIAVGQTSKVFEDKINKTLSVMKLIAKEQLPDSVQYRFITVGGADMAASKKSADSIITAIKGGADFEVVAKNYNQGGQKVWFTTAMYQNEPSIDIENVKIFKALNTMAAGEIREIELSQANVVMQVLERKAFKTKYTAAVIRKDITFSDDTYHEAFNKFSSFVSANRTAEDLINNAKQNGYTVLDQKNITTTAHTVANVSSTKEVLRWLFEAKVGDVSKMTQCGENDHMLIAILDKINKKGFAPLDNPQVAEQIRSMVIRDKKAAMLEEKVKDVKTIADAEKAGAKVSTVDQIKFSDSRGVYVETLMTPEVALAGAVAGTKQGEFSAKPVRGNAGVYLFKVNTKVNSQDAKAEEQPDANAEEKKDANAEETAMERQLSMQRVQTMGRFLMQELYQNANVVDNRYTFF